jgi:hypothetical protein
MKIEEFLNYLKQQMREEKSKKEVGLIRGGGDVSPEKNL